MLRNVTKKLTKQITNKSIQSYEQRTFQHCLASTASKSVAHETGTTRGLSFSTNDEWKRLRSPFFERKTTTTTTGEEDDRASFSRSAFSTSTLSSTSTSSQEQNKQEIKVDKYAKGLGPLAQLVLIIYRKGPIDSHALYANAKENNVSVHSRRHMKELLNVVRSNKQHQGSQRGRKKKFDGLIRAERPENANNTSTGAGANQQQQQKNRYSFVCEEKGKKHLLKLGLIEVEEE